MYIEDQNYTYTVGRNPFTGIMNALLSRELLTLTIVPGDGDSASHMLMQANRIPNKIRVNDRMDYSEKGRNNEAMLFPGDVLTLHDDKYSYSVLLFDKNIPEKSDSNFDNSSNQENRSRRPSSKANVSQNENSGAQRSPNPSGSNMAGSNVSGSNGGRRESGASDRKSSTAKVSNESGQTFTITEAIAKRKAEEAETVRKAKWGLLGIIILLIALLSGLFLTREPDKAPQGTGTRMLRGVGGEDGDISEGELVSGFEIGELFVGLWRTLLPRLLKV